MAVRPPQIRYLTEGLALGAAVHKGFAATWNWLLAWVNFFKAGKGLRLAGTGSGHPRLDVQIEPGDGIDVTCGGDGKPYIISLTSQYGDGGGGEPEEPWDPDYPWDPDDPWNPDYPWDPDDPLNPPSHFDPNDPWDPDDPWNPDDEDEEEEEEDEDDDTDDEGCNDFSADEDGEAVGDDPGMNNAGDDCKILNGW